MLERPDPSIISVGTFELSEPFRLSVLTEVGSDAELTMVLAQGWRELQGYLAPAILLDVVWVGASPQELASLEGAGFSSVFPRLGRSGETWNQGLSQLRSQDPDAVILCEANGIFDLALVSRYVELILDGYEGIALFDLFLANPQTGQTVFWSGHTGERKGWWVFTGACFGRSWLAQLDWSLWAPDAADLETSLTARVDRLASSARHAGEHRVCGVQGWQIHPLVFREDTPDGFFEQSGEAADVRPWILADLLTYFGAGPFATNLYRLLAGRPDSVLSQKNPGESSAEHRPAEVRPAQPAAATVGLTTMLAEGERAFATGDLQTAQRLFQDGLLLAPGHPETLNNLGVVRHAQGALDEAEALFLKALFLNENATDPVVSLIHMAQGEGRHRDALLYILAGLRRDQGAQFARYAKASLLLCEDAELSARVRTAIAELGADSDG